MPNDETGVLYDYILSVLERAIKSAKEDAAALDGLHDQSRYPEQEYEAADLALATLRTMLVERGRRGAKPKRPAKG